MDGDTSELLNAEDDDVDDDNTAEEGRYAESVEELTDEEIEEVEVNKIMDSFKDEL